MDTAKLLGQTLRILLYLIGTVLVMGFMCAVLTGLWNGTWP
jgi:hypothetical protein